MSVREAAAEVAKPNRGLQHRKPLPPEGEAWLQEFKGLWNEADTNPHWKEAFAREIYRRGDITLEQRNRIIKAAWAHPELTDEQRRDSARRALALIRDRLPPAEWKAIAPVIGQFSGLDLAIAIGDAIECRQH